MTKPFNIHDWQAKQRLSEADNPAFRIDPRKVPGTVGWMSDRGAGLTVGGDPKDKQYDSPEGEGKMAKADIIEIVDDAQDIAKMIQPNTNLPEWVESKITKAADYLNTVKDYLSNYDASRGDEDIDEASMTGTGASFNAGEGEGYMTPRAFKKKNKED